MAAGQPVLREGVYAAAIEVRHSCPIGDISRRLPDLQIAQWCASHRDMFQASGPKDQVASFREWLESGPGVQLLTVGDEGLLAITEGCRCAGVRPNSSVSEALRAAGVWDIPPIIYRQGWEAYRLLAWNERAMRDAFRGIRALGGEVRIVSLRPIENVDMEQMMLVPASDMFAGLTERQSSAILLALRHGYFSLPSSMNIDRLAEGAGVSASTFSEHLRKAQSRILLNLRPHLEAYATRLPGEVVVEEVRPPLGAVTRATVGGASE